MTELLLPHNLTDQDMTIIDKIPAPIVHHTDLLINRHIPLDIDRIHTP